MTGLYVSLAVVLATAGIILFLTIRARRDGRVAEQNDAAQAGINLARRQADAAAKAPQGQDDLVRRIREQGL